VVFVCSFILLAVMLHGSIADDAALWKAPMDHHKYLAMASSDLGTFHIAPFCWRVGPPAIASLFPASAHVLAFQIMSMIGLAVTILGTAEITRRYTESHWAALFTTACMLGVGWFSRGLLLYAVNVDALAMAFGVLAILSWHRGRHVSVVLALAAGAACKEAIILFAIFIAWRYVTQRRYGSAGVAIIVPVLVLMVIRMLIPPLNDDPAYLATLADSEQLVQLGSSQYGLTYIITTVIPWRLTTFDSSIINALTFDAWGLLLIGMISVVIVIDRATRWPLIAVLLLTSAQTLVAVNVQRTVLAALPMVMMLVVPPLYRWRRIESWHAGFVVFVILYFFVTLIGNRPSLPVLNQASFWLFSSVGYWFIIRIRRGSWFGSDRSSSA
jgi:hypothetical protein